MNKQNIWVYRLAIVWALFFTVTSLGSAITIALQNAMWSALDGQGRFLLVTVIVVNWGNTMMAFISKSATKIEDGQSPMNGGTDFFKNPEPPKVEEKKP